MKRTVSKWISLLLALTLAVSLAACGGSGEAPGSTPAASAPADSAPDDAASGETGSQTEPAGAVNTAAFDSFARPVIKADGDLKVGCVHPLASYSSTNRSIRQLQIECNHRGWQYVDGQYESTDQVRDVWNALLNADCDVIYLQGLDSSSTYSDMISKTRDAGVGLYSSETAMTDGIIATVMLAGGVASMEMAYELGSMTNFTANVCVATAEGAQQHIERTKVFEGLLDGVFGTFTLLASEDMGGPDESAQNVYDTTLAWVQQYGDNLNMIYASCDSFAQIASDALIAAGYGDSVITAGIDGDSTTFPALMQDGPFKLSYMQGSELFVHTACEIIDDIQVKGLNPGDDGCDISRAGEQIYLTGTLVTKDDIPASGTPIHALFDYYDPDDADAWYNWEAPAGVEPYVIEY